MECGSRPLGPGWEKRCTGKTNEVNKSTTKRFPRPPKDVPTSTRCHKEQSNNLSEVRPTFRGSNVTMLLIFCIFATEVTKLYAFIKLYIHLVQTFHYKFLMYFISLIAWTLIFKVGSHFSVNIWNYLSERSCLLHSLYHTWWRLNVDVFRQRNKESEREK